VYSLAVESRPPNVSGGSSSCQTVSCRTKSYSRIPVFPNINHLSRPSQLFLRPTTMNSNLKLSSRQKSQAFFNSTLRFSILRAICIFAILLLCNIPTDVLEIINECSFGSLINGYRNYERMRMIYSYFLYSFTLLHHFARSFQSISLTLTSRVNSFDQFTVHLVPGSACLESWTLLSSSEKQSVSTLYKHI